MKRVVFIISGGEIGDFAFFRKQIKKIQPAAIVCADSGADHLKKIGVVADLLVGDLDSVAGETLHHFENAGSRIVRHPRRKDETDTELALHEALQMHPTEIWIWGAMGKRIDHTLANLSLLFVGVQKKLLVKLIDPWCEIFMIDRPLEISGTKGQTVSLFPVGRRVTGITLTGFEYPLHQRVMEIGHPYGVSNRLLGRRATIALSSGLLLVIRFFKPGVFPAGEGK